MLVLEANYSKKIGLPGYSSHQYSLTLRTEISDLNQVGAESQRLHHNLQTAVDQELQKVGYLPNGGNGSNGNGGNGNGQPRGNRPGEEPWNCSPKQKDLILKITEEQKLEKSRVEQVAQAMFGKGVKQLNKLEASGLIEELFEQTGQPKDSRRQFSRGGGR